MCKIICEYTYTVMERKDFAICKYKAKEAVKLPDGQMTEDITVKGYNLPSFKKVVYELNGSFEEYKNKNTGKTQYTFSLASYKEILPSNEFAIKHYLLTLRGVGKATANKLFNAFGKDVFDALGEEPAYLHEKSGIPKKTLEKIQTDFMNRCGGHELFMYLHRFGISPRHSAKIFNILGKDALNLVKANPYVLLLCRGISFKTADYIAMREGFSKDFRPRIEAGIIEVLTQSEKGGTLFTQTYPLPYFVKDGFLREEIADLIDNKETYNTGNVYLTKDVCYIMALKLLNTPISEEEFNDILQALHMQKRIWISIDRKRDQNDPERYKIYRFAAAKAENYSAKKIVELMHTPLSACENLKETIYQVEKNLGILLNKDQQKGVQTAMEQPVSIITGGPGTGKTSVEKILIEVFKAYHPEDSILLVAPTGRAAKRMSESTGCAASTLHKALMLYADEDGNPQETGEKFLFNDKLIIIDETSMIGTYLLEKLLEHVKPGTRIVFIGDIHQLPSVEVGAVLRELIQSKVVPVTELTITYRQTSGSCIIDNAAKVKAGVLELKKGHDFHFLADETSETISDTVCSLVPQLYKEYGENEVLCLTSYRKTTASGANALNLALRECIRTDLTEDTPFFEKQGIKIYEGDRIMNTRNTLIFSDSVVSLSNGDIGKVLTIKKSKDSLAVVCEFDGQIVTLEDEETQALELAYAMTVHKSQGSEAKAVVLVIDINHARSLKRPLIYTGITRAKQQLYLVGQPYAVHKAIREQDSATRKSLLGSLLQMHFDNVVKI